MAPTSYRGPLQKDQTDKHSYSQTVEANLGLGAPGVTVADILRHKGDEVHSVAPNTPVRDVIGTLTRLRIGALPVVNSDKDAVGIVSERDIVHRLEHADTSFFDAAVETIMTADPVTCTPDYTVEEVMKIMTNKGFRHMPVERDGTLVGFISVRDVVRHRLQEVEYENLKIKQAVVG